jgi:tellurite resistance protein
LAQLLSKFNIGMEPDVRFGSPKPSADQKIVLFKLPNAAPNAPTHAYSVATAILQLAGAVAAADEKIAEEEERHLEIQLENWLHLGSEEKTRLRAFTRWILSVPASFTGMKNKIALFSEKQCEVVGKFLVGVAQADGFIDPLEIKILTKIYKLLGLDAQELYSHAHAAAFAPVTIEPGASHPKVFSLPSAPQEKTSGPVDLDMDSIRVKLAETAAVTALLSDIFADDETQPVKPAAPPDHSAGIAGLDEGFAVFLQALVEKISWTREELEALAAQKGLLLDGALDSINDAAIEAYGSPLFEGDNPMEINPSIAKEMSL